VHVALAPITNTQHACSSKVTQHDSSSSMAAVLLLIYLLLLLLPCCRRCSSLRSSSNNFEAGRAYQKSLCTTDKSPLKQWWWRSCFHFCFYGVCARPDSCSHAPTAAGGVGGVRSTAVASPP
jgi:hypothetical protein